MNRMKSNLPLVLGALLMACCGSAIGNKIGYVGIEQAYLAGFALGVVLLGQLPAALLRKRITDLEAKLAATEQ